MSKKIYEESNLQAIANAIREKNNTQNQYTPSQMANAILQIHGEPNLETLTVTENGNYLPGANKDGFSEVTVNVSGGAESVVQPLSVTQNGTYNPPSGVDGYAPVTVNVSGGSSLPTRPSLPSEYQEVEYIHFDGNSRLYVEAHFAVGTIMLEAEAEDESIYQTICGFRQSATAAGDWNFGFQNGNPRWYLRAGTEYCDRACYLVSPKRVLAKAIIPLISSLDSSPAGMRSMFYIGNYYPLEGSSANVPWTGKLYYLAILKIIQNEWADYYVPCYRKSDNTVGVYDVINDVFSTNIGSGTLTAGPNVT